MKSVDKDKLISEIVKSYLEECGYYFEMSHLITILECHICGIILLLKRSVGGNKNAEIHTYGG